APFLLWIFLAVVIGVLIFFSRKTVFSQSSYAADARDALQPGFEELELEPLHYAYSDDEEFDSSLNALYDDEEIEDWEEELKTRRKPLIMFIACAVILLAVGSFLP
ncbi:MAG: hypothetical protein IJ023_00505, partial [Bacteroidales bacterium]|nr:hypothetical protein [Bacteroidales bacterium]